MAADNEGGSPLSRRWLKRHWVEFGGLAVAVLTLLFLYLRSKSSTAGQVASVSYPASTGGGVTSGSATGGTTSSSIDPSALSTALGEAFSQQSQQFASLFASQQQAEAQNTSVLTAALAALGQGEQQNAAQQQAAYTQLSTQLSQLIQAQAIAGSNGQSSQVAQLQQEIEQINGALVTLLPYLGTSSPALTAGTSSGLAANPANGSGGGVLLSSSPLPSSYLGGGVAVGYAPGYGPLNVPAGPTSGVTP